MTARPLRVLVLSRNYPNAIQPQLGLWVERLVRRTAGAGVEPVVVAPVPYCPPLPAAVEYARFRRIARREQRERVDVCRPRFPAGPGSLLFAWEADAYALGVGRVVDRLFRTHGFDLIHAHFTYPDGVVGIRLGQRYGVPVVITEHALWTGWLDRYPRVRRQAVQASRASTVHLAVSRAGRASIARYAGESPRLGVLPIGVDTEVFTPGGSRPRDPDQVLYVGFINFTKGVDVLLHAMTRLVARRPSARLTLVGGAFYRDTRLQADRLRALASELGLDRAVSFVGLQPPAAVAALMRESSVLVLPSRRESFGSVLVEALACGTPVVATRSGGPDDIVTGEVGRLVPVEQPDALADAIDAVLATPGQYGAARLSAYARARFGCDRVARELVDVYRTCLVHT